MSKKDMRRADLGVYCIRVAFVFSLQTWLAETPSQKKKASTPAYMSVLMSCSYPVLHSDRPNY
ncbi:translation initiation factor SU [Penicillium riverlandense]|uniref:translation initiation factor SU n=1 Tax=Penicillium riverlandense TaxID=1903569 RepID=UPI002549347F|nr:translation initiation factor SU [Penicillium riverlandense]KAJ5819784.1 translation initiation factor SU [Penicillium riverlandense]